VDPLMLHKCGCECDCPFTISVGEICIACDQGYHEIHDPVEPTGYRDTAGIDRFYGGEEPPFAVNDEFASTGNPEDY